MRRLTFKTDPPKSTVGDIATRTLRPGLLVSLRTSLRGNVAYAKQTLESEHLTRRGEKKTKWETERTISDPDEHEAAQKVQSGARAIVSRPCAWSEFGLLCPEDRVSELREAIAEARRLVDEFNRKAQITRLDFFVMTGKVAPDDVEALRGINSEVRKLMDDMAAGVKNLNSDAIRNAANRVRGLGSMLTPDAQARVQMAIDAARRTAREIVKAGEQAAQEIDKRTLRTLAEARTAFLDLDNDGQVAVPKAASRAVDMAPEDDDRPKASKPKALQRELDLS